MTFQSYPKPVSQKLPDKEYHELRLKIHAKQLFCCLKCGFYTGFEIFHLHHIKSRGAGGKDTEENLIGVCFRCHTKIHMGLI